MMERDKNKTAIKITLCAVLVVSLCVMMFFIVYMLNITQSLVPFDLSSVTADKSGYDIDVTKFILPEFIGITSEDECIGASAAATVLSELYRELSGVISEVIRDDCVVERSHTDWNIFAEADTSVYIRYHSELPDCVIGFFADEVTGNDRVRNTLSSYVYEMYLLPNTDGSGRINAAVRDKSGNTVFYSCTTDSILTSESTEKMLNAYRSGMYEYKMAGGQPVFTDNVVTRNILITGDTASFIQSEMSEEGKRGIMRFFALNPDKLLSSHIDEEGMDVFVDTHGSLSFRSSGIEYNSASDGGIGLEDFIGHSDGNSLGEYIKASVSIITYLRSVNKNFAGGDAEIYLDSVVASDGNVKLSFMYAFDGIRICDIEPAFTAEFENGILRNVKLYSISVRYLSGRHVLMLEDSFIDIMENSGKKVRASSIVYRSDFLSESVKTQWQCTEY